MKSIIAGIIALCVITSCNSSITDHAKEYPIESISKPTDGDTRKTPMLKKKKSIDISKVFYKVVFLEIETNRTRFVSTGFVYSKEGDVGYISFSKHGIVRTNRDVESIRILFLDESGSDKGEYVDIKKWETAYYDDIDLAMIKITCANCPLGAYNEDLVDLALPDENDPIVIYSTVLQGSSSVIFETKNGLYSGRIRIGDRHLDEVFVREQLVSGNSGSPVCSRDGIIGIIVSMNEKDNRYGQYVRVNYLEDLRKSLSKKSPA